MRKLDVTCLTMLYAVLSLCLFCGCGKSESSQKVHKSLDSLASDAVLVQVGNRKLTKSEYDERLKFSEAYRKIVTPQAKRGEDKNKKIIDDNVRSSIIITFIQNAYIENAIDEFIATNGPLPEKAAASAKREITLLYEEEDENGKTRKLAEIEKGLDAAGVGGVFRKNLANEYRMEQFLQSYRPDLMIVDSLTVTNFMIRHTVMNAVAEVTNTTILAVAKEVRRRAAADEDFAALAEEYSMDPYKAPGGDLGECVATDFGGEEEIFKTISKLSVGGVTEVIDAGDSWRIYKVLAKIPASKSNSGTDAYHLARIYFRKAVIMPPFTKEQIVHELYRSRRKEISRMILDEAMRRNAVTFPNGWKIFPGASVKKFMANIEEIVHPGGENPYLTPQERAMRPKKNVGPRKSDAASPKKGESLQK